MEKESFVLLPSFFCEEKEDLFNYLWISSKKGHVGNKGS